MHIMMPAVSEKRSSMRLDALYRRRPQPWTYIAQIARLACVVPL
jgi:hypothetical protein